MLNASRRSLLALPALVALLAGCQSMQQDVETVYLPDREVWEPVHSADDGHATIVECVPQGQKLASWRELITIQGLDDRKDWGSPLKVMEELREKMRARGGKLEWKVIEELPDGVLYEWTISGSPGNEDQGELARIVKGKDMTHRVAYAYKGLPLAPERRANRLEMLRKGRVIKGMAEYKAAVEEFFPGEWKGP